VQGMRSTFMQILFPGACAKKTHRIRWHELTIQTTEEWIVHSSSVQ
jgi:hypothetical protein